MIDSHTTFVVYYETIKRELVRRLIHECRCDERLKANKVEWFEGVTTLNGKKKKRKTKKTSIFTTDQSCISGPWHRRAYRFYLWLSFSWRTVQVALVVREAQVADFCEFFWSIRVESGFCDSGLC
jgi:hypothetical protein